MVCPAAVALLAALYQIFRDEVAFDKQKNIKDEEKLHALSVSSHVPSSPSISMRNSLKNITSHAQLLVELSVGDPCKEALDVAEKRKETRLDFAASVTKDTRDLLYPFEKASRQIGINHHLLKDFPVGDKRSSMVEEASDLHTLVMEFERGTQEKEIGVSKVVERIHDLLGINQLTKLR